MWAIGIALVAANVVLASAALLQGLLLLQLISPMAVFLRSVLDNPDERVAKTTEVPNEPTSGSDMDDGSADAPR